MVKFQFIYESIKIYIHTPTYIYYIICYLIVCKKNKEKLKSVKKYSKINVKNSSKINVKNSSTINATDNRWKVFKKLIAKKEF